MIREALYVGIVLAVAGPAAAQSVAIVNGHLVIGDGTPPIEKGRVLIRDGRVIMAGSDVTLPSGIRVVDAKGGWITPGLVATFSDLGLVEIGLEESSNDGAADKGRFSAALDLSSAINPAAQPIQVARAAGITRSFVARSQSSKVFGGQGAAITLGHVDDPIMRPRLFEMVELGEDGAVVSGGSRMSAIAEFRSALQQAQDYRREPTSYRDQDHTLTRLDAKALVDVLDGTELLVAHVERAHDIRTALSLKRDFPQLRIVLRGASEGWMVANEIAAMKIPVIADGLTDLPESFEELGATESNVGRLQAAGVTVGVGAGISVQTRLLPQIAGNLVGLARVPGEVGLSWESAFELITLGPAQAMGMDRDIGSLRPGRLGDVVIWDGDPLEPSSGPTAVWIGGVEQSLRNHQTELRDRYANLDSTVPHAYHHP